MFQKLEQMTRDQEALKVQQSEDFKMLRRDVVKAIRQVEPNAQLGADFVREHLDRIEKQLAIPNPEVA